MKRALAVVLLAMSCTDSADLASPSPRDRPPAETFSIAREERAAENIVTVPREAAIEPREPVPFEVWRQREPIYELYVRHFSPEGNFKGVEDRLPELKALGIGIV